MTVANPKVWLKPGREKSLRRKHPWVFSGAIERVEGVPAPGGTVDVVTDGGDFLAQAAYSPASQIRARVWTFRSDERIDAAWFRARLARAIESRRKLGMLDSGSACRLVFSESDGLPGLIVDRYAASTWCASSCRPARKSGVPTIVDCLQALCAPRGIFERSEGGARHKEGLKSERRLLAGEVPPAEIEIEANGVRYLVDLAGGQKTGAYLDQQRNRKRVAAYAPDAEVLDAFAYTGGFAFASLRSGAANAMLIDSSAEALQLAQRDAARNGFVDRCAFVAANVFDELRTLKQTGRQFDLVVLDPPKFVHSAEQITAGAPRLQGHQHARACSSCARAGCSRRSPARGTSTPRCSRRSWRAPRSIRAARRRSSSVCRNPPTIPSRPNSPRPTISKA